MKRIASLSLSLLACIGLLLATERRAMAYINPGDGMMFVQSAGAAIAATAYFLRSRILALFGKKKPVSTPIPVSAARPIAVQKGDARNAA
jgi:hypothetical protein